ncbi:MAG: hypothetical protein DI551_11425 [Micavibrio aeruginosavorus]|uniref:Uncharacterized protein n=1 Tax=Micavibrio aeruginosavorus TaxID=349221 RepID=A0A2W5PXJ3_9BACT|nr:MAG: hypothetical protein DI551_11425 [Micavibrio aeruginosavorus]
MSIILQSQPIKADICLNAGKLHIDFAEDPSFVRSETVVIDLMHRSIGLIFQNGYHHVGDLPATLGNPDVEAMTNVRLTGHGEGGREIFLNAPIKLHRTAQ